MPLIKKLSKQKLVHKTGKKKQPTPAAANTDGTMDDEGEPSRCIFMANMGTMLKTLTTRIEDLERKRDTHDDTTASHSQYPSRPDVSMSPAAASSHPARQTPAKLHTYPYVCKEVRARVLVTQHLWRAPAPYSLTDEEPASEEEKACHTHSSRGLKSGNI